MNIISAYIVLDLFSRVCMRIRGFLLRVLDIQVRTSSHRATCFHRAEGAHVTLWCSYLYFLFLQIDPRELIYSLMQTYKAMLQGSVVFEARLSVALPALLWADPVRIRQVLASANGITNALKYTSTGTVLIQAEVVHVAPPGSVLRQPHVLFQVMDTGVGLWYAYTLST